MSDRRGEFRTVIATIRRQTQGFQALCIWLIEEDDSITRAQAMQMIKDAESIFEAMPEDKQIGWLSRLKQELEDHLAWKIVEARIPQEVHAAERQRARRELEELRRRKRN